MSFLSSFEKIAAAYSEDEEYKQSNAVKDRIKYMQNPSKEPMADDLQIGDKIVYDSETGWKEGPWGRHLKGCSEEEKVREAKKAFEESLEKELEKNKIDKADRWKIKSEATDKKFPPHHGKGFGEDWRKHAVGVGDKGTVVAVNKLKTRPNSYDIRWDKHPNCVWPNYSQRDLKVEKLPLQNKSLRYSINRNLGTVETPEKVRALIERVMMQTGRQAVVTDEPVKHFLKSSRRLTVTSLLPVTEKDHELMKALDEERLKDF